MIQEIISIFGQKVSGTATNPDNTIKEDYTDKYAFECSAFVNSMIHQALGIGGETFTEFVTPTNNYDASFYEVIGTDKSQWQVGDILTRTDTNHILIYLGGNAVAHGTCYTELYGAKYDENYSSINKCKAYRLTEDVATLIDPENCKASFSGANVTGMGQGVKQSEFYYNGIPNGEYSVATGGLGWIINSIKEIFVFLINIIFYITRMVPVGYTAIIENLISYIVDSIAGEGNLEIDATGAETDGKVTVESIIYNQINVFDVNFFKVQDTTE